MHENAGANPARWCVDPGDVTQWRWWDGSEWTDHVAPVTAEPDSDAAKRDAEDATARLAAKDRKAAKADRAARLRRAAALPAVQELPAEIEVIVVGSEYYNGLRRLSPGPVAGVTVKPEPTNKHDKNALLVEVQGKKAGYLSAYQAKRYRPMIGKRSGVRARFAKTDLGPTLYVMLPKPHSR